MDFEAIRSFMDITGSNEDKAFTILESVGFNLESGIEKFFNETATAAAASSSSANFDIPPDLGFNQPTQDVRAPIADQQRVLADNRSTGRMGGTGTGGAYDFFENLPPARGSGHRSDNVPFTNDNFHAGFSNNRPPPPVRRTASRKNPIDQFADYKFDQFDMRNVDLTDGPNELKKVERRGKKGRKRANKVTKAEKSALATMFEVPHILLFHGSFEQAKSKAISERKMVLVNIQDKSEFISHTLNRDVWSSDYVQETVKSGMIFWQADHDSEKGQKYVNMYHISKFPHIGVIDPRTGEKVSDIRVPKNQVAIQDFGTDLVDRLYQIMEKHNNDSPVITPPSKSNPFLFDDRKPSSSSSSTTTTKPSASETLSRFKYNGSSLKREERKPSVASSIVNSRANSTNITNKSSFSKKRRYSNDEDPISKTEKTIHDLTMDDDIEIIEPNFKRSNSKSPTAPSPPQSGRTLLTSHIPASTSSGTSKKASSTGFLSSITGLPNFSETKSSTNSSSVAFGRSITASKPANNTKEDQSRTQMAKALGFGNQSGGDVGAKKQQISQSTVLLGEGKSLRSSSSTTTAQSSSQKPVNTSNIIQEVPEGPDSTTIMLILPSGKRTSHRFNKNDIISSLRSVALQKVQEESPDKNTIKLRITYPPKPLDSDDITFKTLEEVGICGSAIMIM